LFEFEKWRPRFAEKQVKTIVLEVTPQKRSGKVARQLFGQVWENLGKNPLHPQKFACSYTYATQHSRATVLIIQQTASSSKNITLLNSQ